METNILNRLLAAARQVGPLTPVNATALPLPQFRAGQQLSAQVAARLPEGGLRVVIDGRAYQLQLPSDAKAGDTLTLRVLGQPPQLRVEVLPPATRTDAAVSRTGRLIGQLLSLPQTPPPRQAQPMLGSPTAEPEALAGPLARALERSGLFYESHQARWVRGEFPLERLREEPQAARTAAPARKQGPVPSDAEPALAPQITQSGADDADQGATASRATEAGVARELLPLVRQQIDALENRQIGWIGEIWPGQSITWQITDEHGAGDDPDEHEQWSTSFALDLPSLGKVGARLGISAGAVSITLQANEQGTIRAFKTHAGELEAALAAAGIVVTGLMVSEHEPDDG
jgi:hypothetical protein